MVELQNERLIRALFRQHTDKTPIWIMRQAGRYLPEYRVIRERIGSFTTMCKTPEIACTITLQPVQRYPLDAAIIFSDILIVPEAMGMELEFIENLGPRFKHPIRCEQQIDGLHLSTTVENMPWLPEAIKLVQDELDGRIPLIGFAGSPWTLATYMIEGESKSNFKQIKSMMYSRPDLLNKLLDKLVVAVTECLNAQIKAGAQCVMLFDTWGGILSEQHYLDFSLAPAQKICQGLIKEYEGKKIPSIFFTKGGGPWVNAMAQVGYDALGLDWTIDIGTVRQQVGDKVALQGNMDPAVLTAPDHVIRQEVGRVMDAFGDHAGHVFNLGHGITPDIHPDKVAVLVDAVHQHQ